MELVNLENQTKHGVNVEELELYLNRLLAVDQFADHCPNGKQVAGCDHIYRLAVGVTACLSVIQAAQAWGADALLTHHGFFWKNEPLSITGFKYHRLRLLMQHKMNLFVYHLPLDAHKLYGNNKKFADMLSLQDSQPTFGSKAKLGWCGILPNALSLSDLKQKIHQCLGRIPFSLGEAERSLKTVALCTGAGQNFFEEAINCGADVYLTGEISEEVFHLVHESGVPFLSCGHHATERCGVQALAEHLKEKFPIEVCFFDVPNPI